MLGAGRRKRLLWQLSTVTHTRTISCIILALRECFSNGSQVSSVLGSTIKCISCYSLQLIYSVYWSGFKTVPTIKLRWLTWISSNMLLQCRRKVWIYSHIWELHTSHCSLAYVAQVIWKEVKKCCFRGLEVCAASSFWEKLVWSQQEISTSKLY